ncbi:MAG: hypothetical protein AB1349_00545 [Elusimicrobiota bacterium]
MNINQKSEVRSQKSEVRKFLLLFSYFLPLASCLYGAFEDTGTGARPISIGAYTAIADDANAIFYNSAGLTNVLYPELSSCYGKLYWGLNGPDESALSDTSVGFVYPSHFGTFGLGWLNFGLSGYYSENTILLSYGRDVIERISLGTTLKYLTRKYGQDIYTINYDMFKKNGYLQNTVSGDISILYNSANLSFAVVVKDVNQPDVGLGNKDIVPLLVKFATAYKIKNLNLGLETFYKDKKYGVILGGEKLFGEFALRSGFEFGTDELRNLNLGFGYKFAERFLIDYAVSYPFSGLKEIYGTHRLSIGLKFGPQPKDELSEAKKEIDRLTDEILKLEESIQKVQAENIKLKESKIAPEKEPQQEPQQTEKIEVELDKKKIMKQYYDKGLDYYQKGEYRNAIAEFNEILKFQPDHQQSIRLIKQSKLKIEELTAELYYKGLKEYTKGNVKQAISYWQKALEIDTENDKIKNALEKAKTEIR